MSNIPFTLTLFEVVLIMWGVIASVLLYDRSSKLQNYQDMTEALLNAIADKKVAIDRDEDGDLAIVPLAVRK